MLPAGAPDCKDVVATLTILLQSWKKSCGTGADASATIDAPSNVIVVRYAYDLVAGFEHQADAKAFLTDLDTRFEAFGLSLHPEKTRQIEFGRHAQSRKARGLGKARDIHVSRIHSYLRKTTKRAVSALAENASRPDAGQAPSDQG
jgi:hypothetical protein